jgi:hypothetical protein
MPLVIPHSGRRRLRLGALWRRCLKAFGEAALASKTVRGYLTRGR